MDSFSDRTETIWDIVEERDNRLVLRPTLEKNRKRVTILAMGAVAGLAMAIFSRFGGGVPAAIIAGVAGVAAVILVATFFHRLELTRVAMGDDSAHVAVRGGRPYWASIPRRLPIGHGVAFVRPHTLRYRGSVTGWVWVYTLSAEPRFAISIGHGTREEDPSHVPYDVRDVAGRLSKLLGVPWQPT